MTVDMLLALYVACFLLIALPSVYFTWKAYKRGEPKKRRYYQAIIPIGAFMLLAGGWFFSYESGKLDDQEQRETLTAEVVALAHTINPLRVKQLRFSEEDNTNPAFVRLRAQMSAYTEATPLLYVFSIAQRDNQFVFGPESLSDDHPLASLPGAAYEKPPAQLTAVFQRAIALTVGPYKDEFGSFVSAFAPVVDPTSGEVLMVVGADIDAEDWRRSTFRARVLPLVFSLAMLVFLSVGDIALRWRQLLPVEGKHRWRYIEAALCAFTGIAVTVSVAWLAYMAEERARYNHFSSSARAHASAVTDSMLVMRTFLDSLGRFIETEEQLDGSAFESFAEILARDGLSQSWEWARVVPEAQREYFESQMRDQGLPDFMLWEKNGDGERIPAARRDTYYPVLHVAPWPGNEMVPGYDVGSESVRHEALEEAIRSGMATGTAPIILVQELGALQGTLIFRPVYNEEGLYGFALVTLQFRPTLLNALAQAGQQAAGVAIDMFQLKEGAPPQYLASSSMSPFSGHFCDHQKAYDLCVVVPLFIFGNAYALMVHAESEWVAAHSLWMGGAAALAGLLITAILTAFIISLSNRRAFLENEVKQRTAALLASERQLLEERNKMKIILDSMPVGIYMVTADCEIRYINSVLTSQFGSFKGQKCYKYLEGRDVPCSWCKNKKIFKGEFVHWKSDRLRNGRIYEVFDRPIKDSDGTPCKLSVYHDITDLMETQEALRVSEAQTTATLYSIGDGVISIDVDGYVTGLNLAAEYLTGWTVEEAGGRPISEVFNIINGGDRQEAVNPVWKTLEEGIVVNLANNIILIARDGTERYIADSCAPIQTKDEGLIGAVLVFRDVSQEYVMRRELMESNERFTQIALQSREIIWETDALGLYTYISAAVTDILGYQPEELVGKKHFYDLHPEEGREAFKITGLGLMEKKEAFSGFENSAQHKHGKIITLITDAIPILDETGGLLGYRGADTDVTERRQAEQGLRESEARLNQIVTAAQDAIIMLDSEGNISLWNNAATRIFGYAREEAMGENLHLLLAPERFHNAFAAAYPTFQKTGEGRAVGHVLELAAIRKNKEEFPIELSLSNVQIHGQWHAIGIMRDITVRKRLEKELLEINRQMQQAIDLANRMAVSAEMANAAKSAFLANVSHEIRTPMNGVIGMTQLLLDTELEESQRRCAEVIRDSGESLMIMINDILDFSKIESGKLELEEIDFDLRSLMDTFSMLLAVKAHAKGLDLVCSIEPGVPTSLRGDPGRLRQILTNLTDNAIKFTHKGEVVVRVSFVSESENGALLRFSVRDTGIGIPENKKGILFQSFTQLDPSTTRKYGGTGLGLSITKQLVELMGGEIGVTSVEDNGSEFWFTLRLSVRSDTRQELTLPDELRNARVLVVDDNAANRQTICAWLRALGLVSDDAPDGVAALKILHEAREANQPFNVVIMDAQTPEMDGEALGRAILDDERLKDTSLVVMVLIGELGDARRYEKQGFAAHLAKPVRQTDLVECLSAVLATHDAAETPTRRPMISEHSLRELIDYQGRILLAEDNVINQQVVQGILKKTGIGVDVVNNGREAVDALKREKYGLVLMDVQMPEMDGLEATRLIRATAADMPNPKVKIIALTAHSMQEDFDQCLQAGMDDYISKPVEANALIAMLKKWLPDIESAQEELDAADERRADTDTDTDTEPTTDAPLLDKEGLFARVLGDEELVRTLIATFLEDMPQQLEALRGFLDADDGQRALRQAHTIKGAAANLGAIALSRTAEMMEQAGKANDFEEMKRMFPELEACYAKTKQVMETL